MRKIILFLILFLIGPGSWIKPIFADEVSETKTYKLKCKDCNLIMISLSNISAGHMSLYEYERMTTPNLDKWAEDAIVFKDK